MVDILSRRCMKVRESVENHRSVILSLLSTVALLTKYSDLCPKGITQAFPCAFIRNHIYFRILEFFSGAADTTKFLSLVKSTDLFGSIAMLYSTVVPVGKCFFWMKTKFNSIVKDYK